MKKRYVILLTTFFVSTIFFVSISMYLFTSIFIPNFNYLDELVNPIHATSTVESKEYIQIEENNQILQGYLSCSASNIYVLVVHGYGGAGQEMDWASSNFIEMGWNVLAIDLQGNGSSEGNVTTLGTKEQEDIVAWINYLVDFDSESQIILYGVSMGAVTILNALDNELPTNVKAVIEDSAFTSIYELFEYHLNYSLSLSTFPLLFLTKIYASVCLGINIVEGPIDSLASNTIPILFIHGLDDICVPVSMAQELYDACTSEKQLYLVEDAGHVASNEVDKDYWNVIKEFIGQYVDQ
ncbi:alpha/beta hydrolase [Tannockella kyphosi]|uniref:alpha/beta hydrolase n=1 Tax=Tannockella kyphosi TaxID=2899121 RepID=UPI002010FF1A|nr:alpha/beta hydrolase [Tannockella kyphosi]